MRFQLVPTAHPIDAEIGSEDPPVKVGSTHVPGFFYDYLRNSEGQLVGVRYWGMSDISVVSGPLLEFLADPRFVFHQAENFVDIVFFAKEIESLKRGALAADSSQDFGGDFLMDIGGRNAIVFDIPD